jgi:hypothetical protein
VAAGSKVKLSLPVVITNTEKAVTGEVLISIYADTGVDSTRVLLTTVRRRLRVSAGRSETFDVAFKSMPASAGKYQLLAEVTDPSGATSITAPAQSLEVSEETVAARRSRIRVVVTP